LQRFGISWHYMSPRCERLRSLLYFNGSSVCLAGGSTHLHSANLSSHVISGKVASVSRHPSGYLLVRLGPSLLVLFFLLKLFWICLCSIFLVPFCYWWNNLVCTHKRALAGYPCYSVDMLDSSGFLTLQQEYSLPKCFWVM